MSDLLAAKEICQYKTTFNTKSEAKDHAVFRKKRDGSQILIYQCEICKLFHPTGSTSNKVKLKPSGSGKKRKSGSRKNTLRKDKLW